MEAILNILQTATWVALVLAIGALVIAFVCAVADARADGEGES